MQMHTRIPTLVRHACNLQLIATTSCGHARHVFETSTRIATSSHHELKCSMCRMLWVMFSAELTYTFHFFHLHSLIVPLLHYLPSIRPVYCGWFCNEKVLCFCFDACACVCRSNRSLFFVFFCTYIPANSDLYEILAARAVFKNSVLRVWFFVFFPLVFPAVVTALLYSNWKKHCWLWEEPVERPSSARSSLFLMKTMTETLPLTKWQRWELRIP